MSGLTPLVAATPASGLSRLCAVPADTVAPIVTSVSVSADSVDLAAGPGSVTVTADATDSATGGPGVGVKHIGVRFDDHHIFRTAHLTLVSGDATDGEWQGQLKVPQYVRSGQLRLIDVIANDADRNFQTYFAGIGPKAQSPTDPQLHPTWPTSIAVTNGGQKPPTVKAGTLTDFSFTPTAVDSRHGSQRVSASATFSGVRPSTVRVLFRGNRVGRHEWGQAFHLKPVSKHTMAGSFAVPRWAGATKAHVVQLAVDNQPGVKPFFENIMTRDLVTMGFPTVLTIHSRLDDTAPTLTALTVTPTDVDSTTQAQTVHVAATLKDPQSGTARVRVLLEHRGTGRGGYRELRLKRDGDSWTANTRIPQCAPSGPWRIYVEPGDRAHNYRAYRPDDLDALGFPSALTVTSGPQREAKAPTVANSTASGTFHTITLDFSEGVTQVSDTTLSVFALEPAAQRYASPEGITSISCGNGVATVACDGTEGLVTSAMLTVPTLAGGSTYEIWANLNGITPQLIDGAGNPMAWRGSAATVTGA